MIKRYEPELQYPGPAAEDVVVEMKEVAWGDYVLAGDYQILENDYNMLQDRFKEISQQVERLWLNL